MLSFEEKKAIFHSFKLKEKKMSNGKVSFVYPESIQKGQVLATQIHPSGNGYVIGKYMSEETIKKYGYQVDPRGWISIKVFSKEEISKVITEAMKSMSREHVGAIRIESKRKQAAASVGIVPVIAGETMEPAGVEIAEIPAKVVAESFGYPTDENVAVGPEDKEKIEKSIQQGTYEFIPSSFLSAWMGLTLSTMEYGYLVWRKALRDYMGFKPTGMQDRE